MISGARGCVSRPMVRPVRRGRLRGLSRFRRRVAGRTRRRNGLTAGHVGRAPLKRGRLRRLSPFRSRNEDLFRLRNSLTSRHAGHVGRPARRRRVHRLSRFRGDLATPGRVRGAPARPERASIQAGVLRGPLSTPLGTLGTVIGMRSSRPACWGARRTGARSERGTRSNWSTRRRRC